MKRVLFSALFICIMFQSVLAQTAAQTSNQTTKKKYPNPFIDILDEPITDTAQTPAQPQNPAPAQAAVTPAPASSDFPNTAEEADMNSYIIKVAEALPRDGSSDYFWPKGSESPQYDGSNADVYFMGTKVMSGEPQKRSYCCGLTLQIFYTALNDYMKDNNLKQPGNFTPQEAKKFRTLWFVENKNGDGPGAAMFAYGMAAKVNSFEEAKRGDFVQLWRNSGSGHSVIFWDSEKDAQGKVTAVKYFSTQKSTKGINFNTEQIGGDKGLNLSACHISRMLPPSKWKK